MIKVKSTIGFFANLKRDFVYGISIVLIAAGAICIYTFGTIDYHKNFFGILLICLVGVGIAESLKYGLTSKHLSFPEIFQDIIFTGILAVSSSAQPLLHAASSWHELMLASNVTVTIIFLIYHISNACILSTSGKHLRFISGLLIIGTPYLCGWVLLLSSPDFFQLFGKGIFIENICRFFVIFSFNEVIVNAISLVTKNRIIKNIKVHLLTIFVSLIVVLSPIIADFGSTATVAGMPAFYKYFIVILTTILSQAGLWAEVYLVTGMILDSIHDICPSWESAYNFVTVGIKKGIIYSGIFMTILFSFYVLFNTSVPQKLMTDYPMAFAIISLGIIFPLIKTILETFDGSQAFFQRVKYSYKNPVLYLRGAVIGLAIAYGITNGVYHEGTQTRILFGLIAGLSASAGVSILRDIIYSVNGQGHLHSWKVYFIDSLLGGFIGMAMGFYLDTAQISVIAKKINLYNSSGLSPELYTTYPLINKWGRINIGQFSGGVKLLFNEALAGVINWSVAAWLFAINRAFITAIFQKDTTPIKFLFSKQGFIELIKHMIQVLRWGLWMSPIIFTFLRMMPEPTWYNQDGAVRSLFAIFNNATMSSEEFNSWSLKMFVYLLAYGSFRVLIWIDHMGLRVATMVNLSFQGMDKLDEIVAKFIGASTTKKYIPEAVKRFTTWAPLLIPFYIPRGPAWDYVWSQAESVQNAAHKGGIQSYIKSLSVMGMLSIAGLALLICVVVSFVVRWFIRWHCNRKDKIYNLKNNEYEFIIKENGGGYSCVPCEGYDISRRSYDTIDPCGRILYIVDTFQASASPERSWPVAGNFPKDKFNPSIIKKDDSSIKIVNVSNGIKTTIDITLPDLDITVELWKVTVENLTEVKRSLKVVPYLEWVLEKPEADRGHTQYNRLFPEMEYASEANAILAFHRHSKVMGILASDISPEGFLTSRMDFIGRAGTVWHPRILETLSFSEAVDTTAYPTFDPIGGLMVNVELQPESSSTVQFMIGSTKDKETSVDYINKFLKPQTVENVVLTEKQKGPMIGHGEILPGTALPYTDYIDDGNKMLVHTPFTPRPFDHTMANSKGHVVAVTNRGFHTTTSGDSKLNRLTPDWADTVTKEVPGEAIYLYDKNSCEWFSPTYHPLNDKRAEYETEFGVDGTAVFRMSRGKLSTELTVFVPPDEPVGVYILTIRNEDDVSRQIRVAPYFQIVLSDQPEHSGPLKVKYNKKLNAIWFNNPRNSFCSGPGFAAMSLQAEKSETKRGKFFGKGRGVTNPFMVEKGNSDITELSDSRAIATLLGEIEIPAREERTVIITLGQTPDKKQTAALIKKYQKVEVAQVSLEATKKWWLDLMGTVKIKTNKPEFNHLQNWLKYQGIVERVWARRGFYQTSGAFGFRDQLQDTVNLMWVDPALARKQIILHSSQQFLEGDVVHWFFTALDGRTAFANRTHASDNLLWLVWGVSEYIKATNDSSILEEKTSYLKSENPFEPLPKNKHGVGTVFNRSAKEDSVYKHCLKSINLVFNKRMGKHGLPLIGTGDWNDGLDEIGSEGRGESVWLGFFLYYILNNFVDVIEKKDGKARKDYYLNKMKELEIALEAVWRDDRYLRAIHDDGTEIGVKDSGVWEIDALTAAWAVMSGINPERGRIFFDTAIKTLEIENTILLGWPPLREDTKPYLGRSSQYPAGVRENGMYSHGVQWLIKAARILAEQFECEGNIELAKFYKETTYRLWMKISPISHVTPEEIEVYGGQPNKQCADYLTTFDPGRMIWNGYTGAAGWLFRQALEGIAGVSLINNEVILPEDLDEPRGELKIISIERDVGKSPI